MPSVMLSPMRAYGVAAEPMESIMRLTREVKRAQEGGFFDEWHWGPVPPDAQADRARSVVAAQFLKGGKYDVCLMLDDDVSFQTDDLEYVARQAYDLKGLVGGIVSKRTFDEGFGGRMADGKLHELYSDEIIQLNKHQYLGAAVMAFHRDVLLKIAQSGLPYCAYQGFWPFFMPMILENEEAGVYEYLSEDWAICHRARRAGISVHALMRPVSVHHGVMGFTALDGNYHIADQEADGA